MKVGQKVLLRKVYHIFDGTKIVKYSIKTVEKIEAGGILYLNGITWPFKNNHAQTGKRQIVATIEPLTKELFKKYVTSLDQSKFDIEKMEENLFPKTSFLQKIVSFWG